MKTMVVAGESARVVPAVGTVVHSHYYDAAFHRALTGSGRVDGRAIVYRAAADAALAAGGQEGSGGSIEESVVDDIARTRLGEVDEVLVQGDRVEVVLRRSHHAAARLEIFGPATTPVCDVAAGVLAGALEALAGRTYTVEEVECMAAGGSACRFRAVPAASGIDERPSESAPHGRITAATRPSGISAAGALPSGLRDGTLPGSTYGRLWSDFYARAALDFEVELPRSMGPKYGNVAPVVLAEAAHQGIFHGFARLLRSVEWTESVSPALSTTAHRLEALVSLAAHLGWGEWSIALLDPDRRLTMHVRSGYEAMYRLDRGLRPTGPTCHFARGAVAALMNLVSVGDVQTPPDVDQSLYNSVFRNPHSFRAIETRCQALGDAYCEIVANPLSPRGRFS